MRRSPVSGEKKLLYFFCSFLGSIVVSAHGRRGGARGEVLQSSRRLKLGFGFGFDEKLEAISPAKDVVDFITKRVLVRWTRLIYRSLFISGNH